jgi:hypothetical protein
MFVAAQEQSELRNSRTPYTHHYQSAAALDRNASRAAWTDA